MRKFNKFLYVLAALSFVAVACEEEEAIEPGEQEAENCYGVYFPAQEASGSHILNPTDETKIEVKLARTNTDGAITVPIVATYSEDGIFTASEATFADGQDATTFTVTFPNIKEGAVYEAHFTIEDYQYASLYSTNATGLDFSIMQVKMETLMDKSGENEAVVSFTEGYWGYIVEAKVKFYEVDGVRTCETFDEVIKESEFSLIPAGNTGFFGCGDDNHFHFIWFVNKKDDDGNQMIDVPRQYMGFDYNDGDWVAAAESAAGSPIYTYDWFHYYTTDGGYAGGWPDWEGFLARNPGAATRSYYDGNGGFIITTRYYIPGLGGWSPDDGNVVGIIPGYLRVDYSFEVESDYPSGGVSPIYLTTGADVASVNYQVYEGSLNGAQVSKKVEELIGGADALTVTDELVLDPETNKKYATLQLEPEKTGTYTFVAIALDAEGKVQNEGSVVFKCITAADEADYAVDIQLVIEDTPARYKNLHDYDSFAYTILGSDLTDVHVGIFDDATIAKYGAQTILDAVKEDEDGDYAVTEEELDQIQAEGGLFDVCTSLKANTLYYMIVWATNGELDTYALDAYTTAKLPYVWNSIGKGTWTDGNIFPLFGDDDVTVDADVYEEATIPGLYMFTGFQLSLAALFYGVEESVLEPYEGEDGNWYNAQVVVDATDPTAVRIEEQPVGIYVNSTYGWYLIDSEATGTLADGVITWPTREVYVGFSGNGAWYYGNKNGTFQLTLPTAPSAPALSAPAVNKEKKSVFILSDPRQVKKTVVSYERDAQPAQNVKVSVSYDRRTVSSKANPEKAVRLF